MDVVFFCLIGRFHFEDVLKAGAAAGVDGDAEALRAKSNVRVRRSDELV